MFGSGDLCHRQPAAEAVRDREGLRRHHQAAHPPDRAPGNTSGRRRQLDLQPVFARGEDRRARPEWTADAGRPIPARRRCSTRTPRPFATTSRRSSAAATRHPGQPARGGPPLPHDRGRDQRSGPRGYGPGVISRRQFLSRRFSGRVDEAGGRSVCNFDAGGDSAHEPGGAGPAHGVRGPCCIGAIGRGCIEANPVRPDGERSYRERSDGEHPHRNQSNGQRPHPQRSVGHRAARHRRAGHQPAGEHAQPHDPVRQHTVAPERPGPDSDGEHAAGNTRG